MTIQAKLRSVADGIQVAAHAEGTSLPRSETQGQTTERPPGGPIALGFGKRRALTDWLESQVRAKKMANRDASQRPDEEDRPVQEVGPKGHGSQGERPPTRPLTISRKRPAPWGDDQLRGGETKRAKSRGQTQTPFDEVAEAIHRVAGQAANSPIHPEAVPGKRARKSKFGAPIFDENTAVLTVGTTVARIGRREESNKKPRTTTPDSGDAKLGLLGEQSQLLRVGGPAAKALDGVRRSCGAATVADSPCSRDDRSSAHDGAFAAQVVRQNVASVTNVDAQRIATGHGHRIVMTGSVAWCVRCGGHAESRVGTSLAGSCEPVRHAERSGRASRLSLLLRGRHPVTRLPLA